MRSDAVPRKRNRRPPPCPDPSLPYERYTPERVAEFLLSCAVDDADCADAVEEVRRLGLDPATIPHVKPGRLKDSGQ
jgi:hypothetical protein